VRRPRPGVTPDRPGRSVLWHADEPPPRSTSRARRLEPRTEGSSARAPLDPPGTSGPGGFFVPTQPHRAAPRGPPAAAAAPLHPHRRRRHRWSRAPTRHRPAGRPRPQRPPALPSRASPRASGAPAGAADAAALRGGAGWGPWAIGVSCVCAGGAGAAAAGAAWVPRESSPARKNPSGPRSRAGRGVRALTKPSVRGFSRRAREVLRGGCSSACHVTLRRPSRGVTPDLTRLTSWCTSPPDDRYQLVTRRAARWPRIAPPRS
jgi:hypothetical protein